MCGIAGIVAADRLRPEERAQLAPMGEVLAHRGPDESGVHLDDRAGLVHRRLSIVDLKTGQQPLANEDGSIWITYNGEVYNHADLRPVLEAAGHVYRTRSDTETIVHAYEQWGDECVEHLRGMFAFAIWDAPRRRLLLARDRLGIKPLYWTIAGGRLVFGSEIKAVLESRLVTARVNTGRIPELLATRYLSGAETLFTGIFRLMPGHVLTFEDGAVRTKQYWDVPAGQGLSLADHPTTFRAAVARFRDLLEQSVRLRLMSDVPLGMFLSGGLDSSAIAALMAPMVDHQLQTFSVAFREHAYSELTYARQVVDAIGAKGHEIVIDAGDFFGALPRLIWHEDEPIAHTSSIPLYFVSKLARGHVKVVLTGEGSDELMAGYGKYLRSVWNWRLGGLYEQIVPRPGREWIADRVVPWLPARAGRYARRSFFAIPHRADVTFFDNFAAIPLREQARLLMPDVLESDAAAVYGLSLAYFSDPRINGDVLQRLLYTDIKTYLVELLMKQDQMSMAASIESRVPFLDHVLVEYVASLPSGWKLSRLTTKRLLREAAKNLLPAAILNRPKMGFPVPFAEWMRGPWRDVARDVLLDRRTRERGVVNPAAVEALFTAHSSGRFDGGDRLWSLLNLELWFRTFIDGEGIQSLAPPVRVAPAGESMVA